MQCLSPIFLCAQDMYVPCGKCAFCSATRRSDWATRLEFEAKLHLSKKFVTLTYANPHLTWKYGMSQLVKADLQKWFKRVRKKGAKIRYFAVGEYGSTTYRPHYHVLLFGDVDDVVIRSAWPLGQVHIGTVTEASIKYCLGYMTNKSTQFLHNRVLPFSLMSRRPGIGSNYLTDAMIRWHRSDRKNYVLSNGVRRHLPRFYKVKIFTKIDLVRIAVRTQKELFKKEVEWIRSPAMRKLSAKGIDLPFKYRDEQLQILAKKIRRASKENLII